MATIQNTLHRKPNFTRHRLIVDSGGISSGDSSDLTTLPINNAIDCTGWQTVIGYVKLTGGSTPTVTLQSLELINYEDTSGDAQEVYAPRATSAVAQGDGSTFAVDSGGGKIYIRVDAVTGSPTQIEIYLAGERQEVDLRGLGR